MWALSLDCRVLLVVAEDCAAATICARGKTSGIGRTRRNCAESRKPRAGSKCRQRDQSLRPPRSAEAGVLLKPSIEIRRPPGGTARPTAYKDRLPQDAQRAGGTGKTGWIVAAEGDERGPAACSRVVFRSARLLAMPDFCPHAALLTTDLTPTLTRLFGSHAILRGSSWTCMTVNPKAPKPTQPERQPPREPRSIHDRGPEVQVDR